VPFGPLSGVIVRNFKGEPVAGPLPLPPPVVELPVVGALVELVSVFVGGVVLPPFLPELEQAATDVARPTVSATHAPRLRAALDLNARGYNFPPRFHQNGSRDDFLRLATVQESWLGGALNCAGRDDRRSEPEEHGQLFKCDFTPLGPNHRTEFPSAGH
jgi:hypothetical protein